SIKAAAKDVAFDVMSFYRGNQSGQIPGLVSQPPPGGDYSWWTGAVLWSTMLDYWYYSDDGTYNAESLNGLVWQSGPDLQHPFMPPNWTASLGNDDEGLWGMTAMQAAEQNFPRPPAADPSWIELAQAVFEVQAARYAADDACNGGLRWQLSPVNQGYMYKNTVSTAVFLNLGARLARYTGNQTYAEWAGKAWEWLSDVGYIDAKYNVYDGAAIESNCSDIDKLQFSLAPAVLLQAAAYMYNQTTDKTQQSTWQTRLTALTDRTLTVFFPPSDAASTSTSTTTNATGPLVESACELSAGKTTCSSDMLFYKGVLLRALASAAQLAPFLRDAVAAPLRTTAEAAVASCAGGKSGRACAFRWADDGADDLRGAPPEELNALSAVLVGGVLREEVAAGKGVATNGTAKPGDSSGGGDGGNGASDSGSGSGSSGSGNGAGAGTGSQGNGAGKATGAATRIGFGLVLAALVAVMMS
ncbi:glycoside hydrolase family 76 protein, partial [Thermothielavioides terrestris NRRL 8126]